MLLKRLIALAAGVLFFILGFIAYFEYTNSDMENQFRQERIKYGVDGIALTKVDSGNSTPFHNSSSSSPAASTPTDSSSTPAATPATTPAPAPDASIDTNILIGPVPPPSSSTPDSAPATTPAPVDPNSAPVPPPSSTMNYPQRDHPSFFQLAAYRPSSSEILAQLSPEKPPGVPPPAPAPTTTTTSAKAETSTPSTNEAPVSASGPSKPASIEASVIVLLYHQFVPAGVSLSPKLQWTLNADVFESEMRYLHDNGYHVIPMSDLQKFLKHEIGLPPGSVVITIDDGYKSAIVHAAPILKKYNFPWTYFVYPDFITVNEGAGAASWNDLIELQKEGVDIESHSMTHPTLTKHSQKIKGVWHNLSPEEYDQWLETETAGSKALLEQKLGKTITSFAYPYGAYNKQVEAKTIAAGYQYIFTVADNPVHSSTNPYSIGRYTITQSVVKNFAAYLRQGALGLSDVEPAPGATISDPRPVITATLGYAGTLDPKEIETSVRDFGVVRHDFDPKTNTVRLYLPRDLISPVALVNIRVKDAATGQIMVANWHFNYEASGGTGTHAPIASPATNAPSSTVPAAKAASPSTNAPPENETDPDRVKGAVGTPMEAPRVSPH